MITRRRILARGAACAALAAAEQVGAQECAIAEAHASGVVSSAQRIEIMQITRAGSQPSTKGSADYFTGSVRIDSPFRGSAGARIGGATVTFEPGARTAWHTHPLGQTLIITAGSGWVQRQGGPKEEVRPGDLVWIPPGEKHWHGAAGTTAMAHIAIAEALDGKSVDWMEHVSDEQYRK